MRGGCTDLVPVAVVLGGVAVILQHLGDGALVDALQTELPLAQLQEASGWKREKEDTSRGCFSAIQLKGNTLDPHQSLKSLSYIT